MTKDISEFETPLPFWQVFAVCVIQLCESVNSKCTERFKISCCSFCYFVCTTFVVCVLFPFMAFMVEDMGYTGHRLGYYVGGLAASFCAAQFCSSVFWGIISDRYGRKMALMSGTLGAAFGMLVFGSAKTFAQAVAGRLLSGFLSGNLGIIKSFLAEITDDTNRGRGFSYMSVYGSLGGLVAPLAGGLLSNPSKKYPSFFSNNGFFGEFPYLLPCLLCVALNIIGVVLCALTMTETRKLEKDSNVEDGSVELIETKNPLSSSSSSSLMVKMGKSVNSDIEAANPEKDNVKPKKFIIKDDDDYELDDEEKRVKRETTVLSSSSSASASSSFSSSYEGEGLSAGSTLSFERGDTMTSVITSSSSLTDKESVSWSSPRSVVFNGRSSRDRKVDYLRDGDDDDILIDDSDEICCANWNCSFSSCASLFSFSSEAKGNSALSSKGDYSQLDHSSSKADLELAVNRNKTPHDEMEEEGEGIIVRSEKREDDQVMRRRGVVLAVSSYGLLCMAYILYDETIPLFLKLHRDEGGFSFDSGQIGTLISISAGAMLIFTNVILPKFASKSKQWLYEIGLLGAIPLTLCWPLIAILNSNILLRSHSLNSTAYLLIIWFLLIATNICKYVCSCCSFTAVIIQVNHSVENEYLGRVNGLGQSLASLARAIGPALGGMLWSVSTRIHFVFLNFLVTIVIFLFCIYLNRLLPPSIDFKKKSKGSHHQLSQLSSSKRGKLRREQEEEMEEAESEIPVDLNMH
jgi:MFS family permease